MILLVTNKRDITTDFIVLELQKRAIPHVRLNSEDMSQAAVLFRPQAGWNLRTADRVIDLNAVTAAYYRRPGTPAFNNVPDLSTQDYLADEWAAVLRSLWNALDGRWLNSPFAILRAEDKPRQLREAHRLGFKIPDTLIGNDFEATSAFLAPGNAIGKPLRRALLERGETGEVLFTSRLPALGAGDRAAVELAPVIYQREVEKARDIRATVIGERVFAAAIASQECEETVVDWRRGSRVDLDHEAIELPKELAGLCVALTKSLDLRYGAVDLILDRDGAYWFLEINPNGQWAWIERRTGLPLAASLVDELCRIAA